MKEVNVSDFANAVSCEVCRHQPIQLHHIFYSHSIIIESAQQVSGLVKDFLTQRILRRHTRVTDPSLLQYRNYAVQLSQYVAYLKRIIAVVQKGKNVVNTDPIGIISSSLRIGAYTVV